MVDLGESLILGYSLHPPFAAVETLNNIPGHLASFVYNKIVFAPAIKKIKLILL